MGLPDGPSGHSQETSGFGMYLKPKEIQLMCRIPTWEWTVIWLSDTPNWASQVCDTVSELIRTHGGSRGEYTNLEW